MRVWPLLVLAALTACAPVPKADVAKNNPAGNLLAEVPAAMSRFPATRALPPQRSNAEIAADFIDLEFRMESGRPLTTISRFAGPISVALTGDVPRSAGVDLAALLRRMRTEAGIDIGIAAPGVPASVTVEFLPRSRLQRLAPTAACFVVPRVSSWAEYRANRGSDLVDWTTLQSRERATIFVPSDTSPQEVRDCLHEEVAQAIGPLNDLYRLPDSVFNDDNFHTILTGFDMLILRLHYAPDLPPGLSEAAVRARLPGLLARLNPAGQRPGPEPGRLSPRPWIEAVETAFGPQTSEAARRSAAARALQIARAEGWQDARLAFSYFGVGRLNVGADVETSVAAFSEAARLYRGLPGGEVHAAYVDMQMAAFALTSGQGETALWLADRAMPVVARAENAALLATLLLMKAEALDLLRRPAEARALRLDSIGWARYGFGSEAEVRDRIAEIAALAPRGNDG